MGWLRLLAATMMTVAIPVVLWVGRQIVLPTGLPSWAYPGQVREGLFVLGIMPLMSGFALVELAALVVPRWRPWRRNLDGRRRLYRLSLAVGIAVAMLSAWLLLRWFGESESYYLERFARRSAGSGSFVSHEKWNAWLTGAGWVGGTAILAGLASLVSRFGLGNGLVLMVAFSTVGARASLVWHATEIEWQSRQMAMVGPYLLALLVLGFVVRGARWVLPQRLPASGVAPYALAATVVAMLMRWGIVSLPTGGLVSTSFVVTAVLTALLAIGGVWLFERPASLEDPAWRGRVKVSVYLLLAALTLDQVSVVLVGHAAVASLEVLFLVAVLADAAAVWHAPPGIIVAASIRFDDTDHTVAALRAAGLSPSLRNANLGVLLRAFAPQAPIEVTVPAAEAEAAAKLLAPATTATAPLVSPAPV